MGKFFLGAVLGSVFLAYRYLGRPLDGSAWEVRVRRQAIFAFSKKDTLIFDRGRFTSADKLSSGFLPSSYETTGPRTGTAAAWQASLPGEDGSTLYWQGEVQGDRMEGTVTWTRSDGSRRRYTFRGNRLNSGHHT